MDSHSELKTNQPEETGIQTAEADLTVGELEINILFDSTEELIAFCEAHNFPCPDQRQRKAA